MRGTNSRKGRRGFKDIYNPELPLESIWDLIDRAPFSQHIEDIQLKYDGERQEAMRPIWNSSSDEGEINLETCYGETRRSVFVHCGLSPGEEAVTSIKLDFVAGAFITY